MEFSIKFKCGDSEVDVGKWLIIVEFDKKRFAPIKLRK